MAQLATTGHSAAESRTSGRRTHRQRQSHFVSIARVHAAPEVPRGSANTVCRATRRGTVAGLAACLHLAQQPARALPRGGVDARVANAFNTAFAAGGDFAVRRHTRLARLPARSAIDPQRFKAARNFDPRILRRCSETAQREDGGVQLQARKCGLKACRASTSSSCWHSVDQP